MEYNGNTHEGASAPQRSPIPVWIKLCACLLLLAAIVWILPFFYPTPDRHVRDQLLFDEDGTVVYQGATYRQDTQLVYSGSDLSDDPSLTLISWHYLFRPLNLTMEYYAPTVDAPPFFLCGDKVYVQEAFDLMQATVTVGESETIPYADMLTDDEPLLWIMDTYRLGDITLSLYPYSACALRVSLYYKDGVYYVSPLYTAPANRLFYIASDEFVQMLKDQGIIEAP